jgi:hypothetical protein
MRALSMIASLCVALTFAITSASSSRAQISNDIVKIGVMADMNGPLSTAGGHGSLEAARMAAEEFEFAWRHDCIFCSSSLAQSLAHALSASVISTRAASEDLAWPWTHSSFRNERMMLTACSGCSSMIQ